MQSAQTWLIARDDTFLGICEGLGEDFGINPLWLRLGFAVSLLWNPVAVIAAYFGAGVVVLVSRLIAPNPRLAVAAGPADASDEDQAVAEHESATDNDNSDAEDLAVAA